MSTNNPKNVVDNNANDLVTTGGAINHNSNNIVAINANDAVNDNANNAIASSETVARLGFMEALVGGLVTVVGLRWGDNSLTQSGMGGMRDGLDDILSTMEAGQMDQAKVQKQRSRIAGFVIHLWDLFWPMIIGKFKHYGYRAWILCIRPCCQRIWEKVQQWCGCRRAEHASRE